MTNNSPRNTHGPIVKTGPTAGQKIVRATKMVAGAKSAVMLENQESRPTDVR